jgi:hypothetical protein
VCGRTEAEAEAGAAASASPEPGDDAVPGDAAAAGGFNAGRRLCDDGSCVGVVGDDGVCRVCGRRAE